MTYNDMVIAYGGNANIDRKGKHQSFSLHDVFVLM